MVHRVRPYGCTRPASSGLPPSITASLRWQWLKANVYAAPLVDSRMSKLLAICKVQAQPQQGKQAAPAEEDKPIRVEEIVNASSGNMQGNKEQGRKRQQA